MLSQITRDQILSDMETIYRLALDDGKWSVALHAKELQGKAIGLFTPSPLPTVARIADMTEDQLQEFLARLEENEPGASTLETAEKSPCPLQIPEISQNTF